mmetsp:Transcript_56608/g.156677  ORF Transcript_56608/g.156677 Transcript_56608/m.156677 type:complete len:471 (+) Transcript_56608:118-1530(+)
MALVEEEELSRLAEFLVRRACEAAPPYALANFLYWYLKVETLADDTNCNMFQNVLDQLLASLPASSSELLGAQREAIEKVSDCQNFARSASGNRDAKVVVLKSQLSNLKFERSVPSPLNPHLTISGVRAEEARMFKSALYPALICFQREPDEAVAAEIKQQREEVEGLKNSKMLKLLGGEEASKVVEMKKDELAAEEAHNLTYKVMLKNGDDVRQDQLVIQLFLVMDKILKQVGLDLKLRPYRVLATGPTSGLLEFIAADDGSSSMPVSMVLAENRGSFLEYFKKKYPDPDNVGFGVKDSVMMTFAKSAAGYAVITFILGIGDRHLDNVMMLDDGHFLHIDFGYILGDDPKKKLIAPPPFRFTKSMVDAMGGPTGRYFEQFQKFCVQAYLQLRRHASLIYSLCNLMTDAGIEAFDENPEAKLEYLLDKFRLDIDDEESAAAFFDSVIKESINHTGVEVLEGFHKLAVRLR